MTPRRKLSPIGSKTISRGSWLITVHFADLEGRAQPVGFDVRCFTAKEKAGVREWETVRGAEPEPVTAEAVRGLPVAALISEAARELEELARYAASLREGSPEAGAFGVPRGAGQRLADRAELLAGRRRGSRKHWTRERLEQVADEYREAFARQQRPTQAVADAFSVSSSMAAKLVHRARVEGLLGPTTRGKAGGVSRRAARESKARSKRTKGKGRGQG